MSNSSEEIVIEKFIFHVVHHGERHPILMEETPIDGFEPFFRNRIREVLSGNKFHFAETSAFLDLIKEIEKDENKFLELSKKAALAFHKHQDGRVKPGVMILIKAVIHASPKYLLIKYDHENVIYYTTAANKAILKEISNTFSKNKEALQKSVVITLEAEAPMAIVVDKSERQHITDFFRNFLGLRRVYDAETLTNKVMTAYLETVKVHKAKLPKEYTANARKNFYDLVQNNEIFDVETFSQSVFGPHFVESMNDTFKREIKKQKIEGEAFPFHKNIRKPPTRRLRTEEGVFIQYPSEADHTVTINTQGEGTVITITTTQLTEE